jgi:glutathione S-transferase
MYTVLGTTKNRTFRVIWALNELGLDYEQIQAAPGSADVKSRLDTGKVPALIIDGEALPDSVAIITFLADRHNNLTFPAGSIDRLRLDGHINFIIEEFDSLLWVAAKNSFINPENRRAESVKPVMKWEYQRSLARLEERLQGEYLMGDAFTIADILAVHCFNWAFIAKFPEPSDALSVYIKRCKDRTAYKKTLAEA